MTRRLPPGPGVGAPHNSQSAEGGETFHAAQEPPRWAGVGCVLTPDGTSVSKVRKDADGQFLSLRTSLEPERRRPPCENHEGGAAVWTPGSVQA